MKGIFSLSLSGVSRQRFERSQWCPSDRVSIWYVIYRVLVPIFMFSGIAAAISNFQEDNRLKWFIFLTDQGITLLSIHFSIEALIVVSRFVRDRRDTTSFSVSMTETSDDSLPLLYKVSWVLGSATFDLALIISIVYWTVLHAALMAEKDDADALFILINVFVHGVNALVCVLDICVSNRPWRPFHFVFSIGYGLLYVTFSAIYFLLGGTGICIEDDECIPYIYPFLNWGDNLLMPLAAVALICLFDIVLHQLWCLLYHLRTKIAAKIMDNNTADYNNHVDVF